ncbi:MAG: acetylxylan esterase [Bryobacterales bacterium]|nr:acetylxylan esterase [Bryobacterales bacterium]
MLFPYLPSPIRIGMRTLCGVVLAAVLFAPGIALAKDNYDESKVGNYELPDPLTMLNGKKVATPEQWIRERRPEILHLYEEQIFGKTPDSAPLAKVISVKEEKGVLGGLGDRKQVGIQFVRNGMVGPVMHLLLYVPAQRSGPVPVFLGLNFMGNQAVDKDPGIDLGILWTRDSFHKTGEPVRDASRIYSKIASESSRGERTGRWQVEKILRAGFGLATIYYGDIEPDTVMGFPFGIRAMALKPGQDEPAADEWGAIGAWAYGLSKVMDYLETDTDVDAKRVAVMGHSRLGKTSLWAGARDQRFAIVISNDSGEGGASIARRNYGERTAALNQAFPHWFCGNFKQYSHQDARLPVDSHMLIALAAPRPVYVASAVEDRHADPRGEFLGAVGAGPVYQLLGKQGLGTDATPAVNQPIMNDIGYHVRTGVHDVTAFDWDQYIAFAKKHYGMK